MPVNELRQNMLHGHCPYFFAQYRNFRRNHKCINLLYMLYQLIIPETSYNFHLMLLYSKPSTFQSTSYKMKYSMKFNGSCEIKHVDRLEIDRSHLTKM